MNLLNAKKKKEKKQFLVNVCAWRGVGGENGLVDHLKHGHYCMFKILKKTSKMHNDICL